MFFFYLSAAHRDLHVLTHSFPTARSSDLRADATKAQLAKRGVEPVLYEGLTRGEKDFSAVVTKIRAAGADVVYFGGLHPEAGPLVRQLREQGLKDVKFMSDDGIVSDASVTTAGGTQFVDGL